MKAPGPGSALHTTWSDRRRGGTVSTLATLVLGCMCRIHDVLKYVGRPWGFVFCPNLHEPGPPGVPLMMACYLWWLPSGLRVDGGHFRLYVSGPANLGPRP